MSLSPQPLPPAGHEALLRRRRGRNLGMLLVLLALVALFYLITIAKLTTGS